jgi:drug/metabolite transporter (DMT)-like permease
MSTAALSLVVLSALLHATWNMVFKRSGGGQAFTLAYSGVAVLLYAPVAAVAWRLQGAVPPSGLQWGFALGSGVIHLGYFLLLDKAYRVGDLSVVYPVARSTGPLLTVAGAMLLFGERPTAVALGGALLIGAGAAVLAMGRGSAAAHTPHAALKSVAFAFATGLAIAAYTIWDRYAVRELGMNVFVYDWLGGAIRALLMLLLFWFWRRGAVRQAPQAARSHWRAMLIIAALSPLSYIVFLYATRLAPLAYLAPARETSVVFGALFGTLLLREGQTLRRLACAVVMCLGLALLATH